MPRLLAALVLLAVAVAEAGAQSVVLEGRVLDAETREPLPGATAQGVDPARGAVGGPGAVADAEGFFRLPLAALPATVAVRFVGYHADTLRLGRADVGADGRLRRTVRLVAAPTPLDEVTVTGENAAVGILRRVLARKAELRRRVPAYAAEGYARLTLARLPYGVSEGQVVRLEEALTNAFWRAAGGGREEVVARRRVPEGGPFRYLALDAVPDLFFDDEVVLDGARYPTPTHPAALALYDVRLGAVTEVGDPVRGAGGLRLFDIAVTPRGRAGLQGRIRVVDSLFVLAEAELRPVGPPPAGLVTAFEATYRVAFSPAGDPAAGVWLPERFEKEGTVEVGTAGVRLPTVRFRQTTLLDNRLPGVRGPAWLWASADRLYSPTGAYGGREVHLRHRDRLPLTPEEAEAERRLGRFALGDLFWKEGLLRQLVPIPVEGADDPLR